MLRTIRDVNLKNKKVLLRCDFNVPIKDKKISDDFRIVSSLPTIKYLLKQNCKIILICHLGRPEGKVVEDLRVDPIAQRLEKLLEKKIIKTDDCIGSEVERVVGEMKPKDIVLLENVRFYKEEEENNPEFARKLAKLGEIFIMDGFGVAHRAHASTNGINKYLHSCAGLLLEKEINGLNEVLKNKKWPFFLLLGGVKISDKMGIINNLFRKVTTILLSGGVASTIQKAHGFEVGESIIEEGQEDHIKDLFEKAEREDLEILLPVDVIVGWEEKGQLNTKIVSLAKIQKNQAIYDIGPETAENFAELIEKAGMIVWCGPFGKFEQRIFSGGTKRIAEAVARCKGYTVVGGGDTLAALKEFGLTNKINLVSTGGGAMLKHLAGEKLPGIETLKK